MKRLSILFIIIFATVFACKKDEASTAPSLEFISITPSEAVELQDELIVSFKYYDEDGDLGENTSGVNNLFIKDSRTEVISEYRVKQLAPDNSNIAIEGILNVTIDPLVISNNLSSEEGVFYIYMTDRAGNQSNPIVTSTFTIKK